MSTSLTELADESIYIIREAYSQVKNIVVLWSMGKDSTVLLHLVRKAFLGTYPFPILHIDTSYKMPEMIAWREQFAKKHGIQLLVHKNELSLSKGMGPGRGQVDCCQALKTDALAQAIDKYGIRALVLGVRGDEEASRSKERIVSPRSVDASWNYRDQPAELWHYYNLHIPDQVQLRIHPLLHWTELDVWKYIEQEKLEVVPLYFAREGKRFRSLGCYPCTKSIDSKAANCAEVIEELKTINSSERSGRAQDLVSPYTMQRLRSAGYM